MPDKSPAELIEEAAGAIQNASYTTSIELSDQAIALDPTLSNAWVVRGIALSQLGQPVSAAEAFQKALELSPESPRALYNYALHLGRVGEFVRARELAERAAKLEPENASLAQLIEWLDAQERPVEPAEAPTTQPEQATFPVEAGAPAPFAEQIEIQPVRGLSFVTQFGKSWKILGWVLNLTTFVSEAMLIGLSLMVSMQVMNGKQLQFDDRDQMQKVAFEIGDKLMKEHAALLGVIIVLFLVSSLAGIVWVALDVAHRKASWLWVAAALICGSCPLTWGLPPVNWLIILIYMLVGAKNRNRIDART